MLKSLLPISAHCEWLFELLQIVRLTLLNMHGGGGGGGGGGNSTCLQIVFFKTFVRDAAEPQNLVTFPKI